MCYIICNHSLSDHYHWWAEIRVSSIPSLSGKIFTVVPYTYIYTSMRGKVILGLLRNNSHSTAPLRVISHFGEFRLALLESSSVPIQCEKGWHEQIKSNKHNYLKDLKYLSENISKWNCYGIGWRTSISPDNVCMPALCWPSVGPPSTTLAQH